MLAEGRYALVLGNSSYSNVPNLDNPRNDAGDVAQAFRKLGYEVTDAYDLKFTEMNSALRSFRRSIVGAEHAVIYFAGHGLELNGRNFLIPVDAELKNDFDVVYEAVPLDAVVQAASSASKLSLVILDACRDNPFLAQMTRGTSTRNFTRGLASYTPQGNSLLAYAARDGAVALDGNGRNSPYASAILSTIHEPGLEISRFFRLVRDKVMTATGGFQEPFVYGSLSADAIYFSPPQDNVQPAVLPTPTAPAPKPDFDASALDLAFWNAIKGSRNPQDFGDYLNQFPSGVFRPLAERRLFELTRVDPENVPTEPQSDPAVPQAAETEPVEDDQPIEPDSRAITLVQPPKTNEVPAEQIPAPEFIASRELVRDAQARLNIIGLDAGPEDGLPGPRTERAIAAFQTSQSLTASGSLDQPTAATLALIVPSSQLQAYRTANAAARPKTSVARTQPARTKTNTTAAKTAPKTVQSPDVGLFGAKNTTTSGSSTSSSGNSFFKPKKSGTSNTGGSSFFQ